MGRRFVIGGIGFVLFAVLGCDLLDVAGGATATGNTLAWGRILRQNGDAANGAAVSLVYLGSSGNGPVTKMKARTTLPDSMVTVAADSLGHYWFTKDDGTFDDGIYRLLASDAQVGQSLMRDSLVIALKDSLNLGTDTLRVIP